MSWNDSAGDVVSAQDAAAGFIRAASEQAAHRLGWTAGGTDDPSRESNARVFVSSLVERAVEAERASDDRALSRAAFELASSPPMLAAFYQNIDLLYADGFRDADAVSALIMRALEHSAEMRSPHE